MLGHRQHAEHRLVPEPRAQQVEQARGRVRIRAPAALEESRIAQRERQQDAGAHPDRDDR